MGLHYAFWGAGKFKMRSKYPQKALRFGVTRGSFLGLLKRVFGVLAMIFWLARNGFLGLHATRFAGTPSPPHRAVERGGGEGDKFVFSRPPCVEAP